MELASARDNLLALGGTPNSILGKSGTPHSAKYVTVVVEPLLVLIDTNSAILCVYKDRLPVGWIQAGAVVLRPNRAPARAYSHNGASNAVRVAADGHSVPRFPIRRFSTHRLEVLWSPIGRAR